MSSVISFDKKQTTVSKKEPIISSYNTLFTKLLLKLILPTYCFVYIRHNHKIKVFHRKNNNFNSLITFSYPAPALEYDSSRKKTSCIVLDLLFPLNRKGCEIHPKKKFNSNGRRMPTFFHPL